MSGFIYGRNPNADTLDGLDSAAFAILAGQAGGQTLQGGTAANEDLTLEGTAHATKATSYVILQPTSGNVGINSTDPAAPLEIKGANAAYAEYIRLTSSAASGGTQNGIAWFNENGANPSAIIYGSPGGGYAAPSFSIDIGGQGQRIVDINATGLIVKGGGAMPATPLHVVGAATITGGIRPAADGTAALTLCKANGDAVVTLDTTNSILGAVGAMQFTEMTAPGAGAANTARIYAKDNGSGKTQLMVQFASGGEIQIAIEA